ncbi:uncharacterized protein LOC143445091 [Clavelina lepadiformis]|uniref:uncharacterized protein LOC143445091 n=1 Tax=Clavelina lepadiformis TaxID=159417 RepID=UPI0040423CF9
MATIESMKGANTLLRPTDLSIKSCLNTKYGQNLRKSPVRAPYTKQNHTNVERQTGCFAWKKQMMSEATSLPSPIALMLENGQRTSVNTLTPTSVIDSAAKLVVLDSLLSQCNSHVRQGNSPQTLVFDKTSPKPRSRGNSDSSNERGPVTNSLIHAVNGLAELQRSNNHNVGADVNRISPTNARQNVTSTSAGKWRGCKRKGGWKFHDLSDESDGLGRRKRAYCHNRLENEILQLYQDRICIKEVPPLGQSKMGDRLVVIEPSYVTDPDLIKHSTSLRIVFDKKRGTYKLQILPFTIEEGSLSDKSQVLSAVAKMLGENGAVLCPGITRALMTPHLYQANKPSPTGGKLDTLDEPNNRQQAPTTPMARKNWLGFAPAASDSSSDGESGSDRFRGRWKILNSYPCVAENKRTPSPPGSDVNNNSSAVTPTDRLLLTLNKELSKIQRKPAISPSEMHASANRCLLWHVPTPGGKGKRTLWPQEAKWCSHCIRNMRSRQMS